MQRSKSLGSHPLGKKIRGADAHVGARVRSRRIQMGISQSALGDSLGVSFQQVQKYERGTNRISASRLHQIAAELGVPAAYFFDTELPSSAIGLDGFSADTFDEFVASPEGVRLMQAFVKIGSKQLQSAIAALVAILSR